MGGCRVRPTETRIALYRTQAMSRAAHEFLTDRPECPRCGYDLRGQTCAWNVDDPPEGGGCPLTGQCTECGLQVEWTEVFHPRRLRVWWFVENARWKLMPLATQLTLINALLVWPFWRRVRLENPINLHRAWLWVLVILIDTVGFRFGVEWLFELSVRADPLVAVELLAQRWRSAWMDEEFPVWVLGSMAASVAAPLVFALLPFSRARSKVRMSHLLRAWAYSFAWLPCIVLVSVGLFIYAWIFQGLGFRQLNFNDPLAFLTGLRDWWTGYAGAASVTDWFPLWPTLIWLSLFWLVALRTGFRMKDWFPSWLSMVVIAWLCGCMAGMSDERFLKGWY